MPIVVNTTIEAYKALEISTIVDGVGRIISARHAYKALEISTIVDRNIKKRWSNAYKALEISTIVDKGEEAQKQARL